MSVQCSPPPTFSKRLAGYSRFQILFVIWVFPAQKSANVGAILSRAGWLSFSRVLRLVDDKDGVNHLNARIYSPNGTEIAQYVQISCLKR